MRADTTLKEPAKEVTAYTALDLAKRIKRADVVELLEKLEVQ